MAGSAFDKTLAGFRSWAEAAERQLNGSLEADVAELGTLFDLMPDYLEKDAPDRLAEGDLTELLLSVYPRKVTVLDRADTAGTIPAVRDLVAYLADTAAITPKTARALGRELDEIEPDFANEVMNPENWGMARSMLHAMHRDGVDLDDQAALDQWIARQNASGYGGLGPGGFGPGGLGADEFDGEPLGWDDADLVADFGFPDVAAPLRLPDEAALAALAAAAPLLASLRDLARQARDTTVRAVDVDPLLAGLAEAAELVERDGDALVPGDDADWLDDLVDTAALDAWQDLFALVVDTTLATEDPADPAGPTVGEGLDLTGHGIALVAELFLGGRSGVPIAELSASLKSAAVADLPTQTASRLWAEWTGAHGDPAGLLLRQLERLSAVNVDDEVAHLAPLAQAAVAARLESCGGHVPELPPPGEMTADDIVLVSLYGTEEDLETELASWLADRAEADAARELLAFAAGGFPTVRTAAVQVATRIGAAAEPAWREVLDRPELRCYAKPALLRLLADRDPGLTPPPELTFGTEDVAWFITDTFAPLTSLVSGSTTFPFDMTQLAEEGVTISHEELFEAMARLSHPDAEAVLTMLGKHADDKKTAKAARKAAFKAASRNAARSR